MTIKAGDLVRRKDKDHTAWWESYCKKAGIDPFAPLKVISSGNFGLRFEYSDTHPDIKYFELVKETYKIEDFL